MRPFVIYLFVESWVPLILKIEAWKFYFLFCEPIKKNHQTTILPAFSKYFLPIYSPHTFALIASLSFDMLHDYVPHNARKASLAGYKKKSEDSEDSTRGVGRKVELIRREDNVICKEKKLSHPIK